MMMACDNGIEDKNDNGIIVDDVPIIVFNTDKSKVDKGDDDDTAPKKSATTPSRKRIKQNLVQPA